MSIHQSIERQERELKDLLQRVMQVPLSPITDSVQALNERMDQLEILVNERSDTELGTLSQGAEETRKQIRSLKSIIEDAPQEVRAELQPLFEQLQAHTEQGTQQCISQLSRDLAGQLMHSEQQAANQAAEVKDAITASQAAIESSQKHGLEYLENLQQTTHVQLHTECKSLRSEVGSKLEEQSAHGQRAVVRVQELLSLHSQELRQQSSSGFRLLGDDADARMSQLTQYIEQLQTALSAQQQQLECLQQEQAASAERQIEQLLHAFLPLRKWVIASVCVAATSLASLLALVVGRV